MSAVALKRATVSTVTRVELGRWVSAAACADHMDLPWITDAHQVSTVDREAMATVCGGCPVLASCAATAEHLEVRAGYWAGQHRDILAPLLMQWVTRTSTRTPRRVAAPRWEQGAFAWAGPDGAA